jgi:hypothetical protein
VVAVEPEAQRAHRARSGIAALVRGTESRLARYAR